MKTIFGVAALVGLLACSDSGTQPNDDFLPIFSNAWRDEADHNHFLQLNSVDDGKATGSFEGEESPGGALIEGTFTHSVVQLTIKRTPNLVYQGKFLAADTLRLTRTGETLVVARQ